MLNIIVFNSYAINVNDSLFSSLTNEKDPVKKTDIYNELFLKYEFTDSLKAIKFVNKALKICRDNNYTEGLITAYRNKGYLSEDHSRYNTAIKYYKKALEIAKGYNLKEQQAQNLINLGNVKLRQGIYTGAIKYYQNALKISENLEDENLISKCLANIGSIYLYQKNFEKAIINYEKAIKISEKLNLKKRSANCLNNLGLASQMSDDYAKAEKAFIKASEILKKIGDKTGLADCYHNLGIVYSSKDSLKRDYKKAQLNYLKSLNIFKSLNNKKKIALTYNSLSTLYRKQENYSKSLDFGKKSLKIAKERGLQEELKTAYSNIYLSHKALNNYKKALDNYELHTQAKDSLNIEKSIKLQAELEAKYENEKKQKEIELKNTEIEKKDAILKQKTTFQYAAIIVIILTIIILVFVYINFRQNKKANILLGNQKIEIENKNEAITNSIKYAKRIQRSILPTDKAVERLLKKSFIYYKPKDIVSGDFYWIQEIDNKILFSVVDCTGHGVPGAFLSIVGHNALNSTVKEFKLSKPSEILYKLNVIVKQTIKQNFKDEDTVRDGMDLALCSLDRNKLKLEYSGANNSIYVVSNKNIKEFSPDKTSIGYHYGSPDFKFKNHNIEVKAGDMVYVFSDGYPDQFGGKDNKKFRYSNFKNLLQEISSEDENKQKEILDKTLKEWMGDREQIDDICIIGLRI